MSTTLADTSVRRMVYMLLITVAAGLVGGRILGVARIYETYYYKDPNSPGADTRGDWAKVRPDPSATHGDNDRSRWDTIRALVENGTYSIGKREITGPDPERDFKDSGICFQPGWISIDKILHPERLEFYSSKPPLLPTILAGEYWALNHGLGWTFADQNKRFWIVRAMLFTINWLRSAFTYCACRGRRVGADEAALALGQLASARSPSPSSSLNNHTVAAWMIFAAPALSILLEAGEASGSCPELFAGFMATTSTPSASLAARSLTCLLYKAQADTTLLLPAMLVPLGALLLRTISIGEWKPAYEIRRRLAKDPQ